MFFVLAVLCEKSPQRQSRCSFVMELVLKGTCCAHFQVNTSILVFYLNMFTCFNVQKNTFSHTVGLKRSSSILDSSFILHQIGLE